MKVLAMHVLCLLCIISFATAQSAPPATFAHAVAYPTNGTQSNSMAVADLRSDGKLDLVVGNSSTISVLLGNGDGTFAPAVTYAGGSIANSLAIMDMNGDGTLDIVAGDSNVISVFLGNGNGTFQAAIVTTMAHSALAVADVDHDGKQDVVLATTSGLATLLGKGDGTFKAPVTTSTVSSSALAVGDLNKDGKPDAVIITYPGLITNKQRIHATVGVLLGNGDGTFRAPVSYDTDGYFPRQIKIKDMDLNGSPDLLVVNFLGTTNHIMGSVGVLYNNSLGSFFSTEVTPGGTSAYAVAGGDLNGDGIPDYAISIDGYVVTELVGGQTRNHPAPISSDVLIGDFNGDGQADLAVVSACLTPTNCSTGAVWILLSTKVPSKTVVTSSLNPSQVGQAVTFTATISSSRGPVPNGVTVTFFNGSKTIGSAITSGGTASLSSPSLPAGTLTIKAKFPGCVFVKPSTGSLLQTVNP